MLAHALEEGDWQAMNLDDFAAEWKWDGIRIQVAAKGGTTRLFSRTGDDIGQSFPELVDHFKFDAVLDGELLVVRNGEVAPFSDLQQRLNRKTVTRAMLTKYPVHVRFYDALEIGGEDLRGLPFTARRERLEAWHREFGPAHSDLSEVLTFASKDALKARWETTREEGIEGLMLKRRESPYLAGRPKGHWYKWKRAALTADCVLLYAQKGSGKRSSFYSDYTFGAWTEKDGEKLLVPVGKAYSGFTDEELVAARPLHPPEHHRTLRPGALGDAEARAGDRLRRHPGLEAPQVRHRHALSTRFAHQVGQAGGRGGHARNAEGADNVRTLRMFAPFTHLTLRGLDPRILFPLRKGCPGQARAR